MAFFQALAPHSPPLALPRQTPPWQREAEEVRRREEEERRRRAEAEERKRQQRLQQLEKKKSMSEMFENTIRSHSVCLVG